MYSSFISWLSGNYIEVIGTILGLLYLYFSIKGNIWLWFFGLATSAVYVYVFYVSKLYADMSLNVYYVLVSIYGFINWKFIGNDDSKILAIKKLDKNGYLLSISITLLLFICIGYMLDNFTDSDIPYLDAFTTAASVVATWMLARKIIDHWLFWIVIDATSLGIYIYKELYATVVLFIIYTIMAIAGYMSWKKKKLQQT
ncbi:MAG: nicotinamide riboside transporter PnuC [Bacteroidetes bacterium]|jgi:nicotinamide mononucleotide transporter|nr:nicotinamide riboside transporter PnuC [Bacteroidota bacterium]